MKILILFLFFLVSCGSPKSVIKVNNGAHGTSTTISQTTGDGGNISVQVSPDVKINVDTTSNKHRKK